MRRFVFILLIMSLICFLVSACDNSAGAKTQEIPSAVENNGSIVDVDSNGDNNDSIISPKNDIDPNKDLNLNDGSTMSDSNILITQDTQAPVADDAYGSNGIDIDLTKLGSTVAYVEVIDILSNPDDYMGKIIKIRGSMFNSYYDQTDKYYQYVIVGDATACCQQGIEFVWNGDHTYPDDYPQDDTSIELVGEFGRYEEEGVIYCYLGVDDITVLSP